MNLTRRAATGLIVSAVFGGRMARAAPDMASTVLSAWYKLVLELVRHTATYSPPVASRAFAYFGITAYEAVASGDPRLLSLAGQARGLAAGPRRDPHHAYDTAIVLHAALSRAARHLFANTGPTGQRALKAQDAKLRARLTAAVDEGLATRSAAYGEALAAHIIAWSERDGGARIANLGFPLSYDRKDGPADWAPTSTIALQQAPLLPEWGAVRSFAFDASAACILPPPPAYSEDKDSEFYREALEVCEVRRALTAEQRLIARFWSDDPMLSPTPPGHWISIALEICDRQALPLESRVEIFAKLGMAMADGFIACWRDKFAYNLLRPVTYIRRVIDPAWEPLLITPPFPEYPSGHSTQSSAAATVLTTLLGENFAFADSTHEREGIAARRFPSFEAAASEAALSRLYGGIHFRAACERGLDQGHCVGAVAAALKTRA